MLVTQELYGIYALFLLLENKLLTFLSNCCISMNTNDISVADRGEREDSFPSIVYRQLCSRLTRRRHRVNSSVVKVVSVSWIN